MHLTEAATVLVPEDRMRKEFNQAKHEELMRSIASKGLWHPPVLRELGGRLWLVAGERRLRAVRGLVASNTPIMHNGQSIPIGQIPFTYLHELDEVQLKEVELEENVVREDLTAIEEIEARAKLFKLRKAKAEAEGKEYSADAFAKELSDAGVPDSSRTTIFRQLAVAKFIDRPEVREAKSLPEAEKALKKVSENFLTAALGEMLSNSTVTPKHNLIVGDSILELAKIPPGQFDCVCTDPPYGIGIDDSGSMVTHSHHYADGPEVLERILEFVPDQLYRITRTQAHVYWFCDLRWFAKISYALEQAGFKVWPKPIIWWKRGKAMVPDFVRGPKAEYECIVFASKGDKPTLKVAGDVIATAYTSDLQQAEKPKELYVELLSRSVMEGANVIDPFCGSGVIFTAAEALKCSAVGIELSEERADFARIRAYGEI